MTTTIIAEIDDATIDVITGGAVVMTGEAGEEAAAAIDREFISSESLFVFLDDSFLLLTAMNRMACLK